MPRIKKDPFDEMVITNIRRYIKENDLSVKKIANATGMTYDHIYQMVYRNQVVQLKEYVKLCLAFNEPLSYFLNIRSSDYKERR